MCGGFISRDFNNAFSDCIYKEHKYYFFYKNPEVRKAVDHALQVQAGMVDKRRKILDMAMDNRILQLEQQVAKLKRENETLRKENEAMRKALNKRDLNLIKNF